MSGALHWSGTIKSKTEESWTYGPMEEMRPDHAIRSSVAITKLMLGHAILNKKKSNNKKGSSSCNLELRLRHYDVMVVAIGA